MTEEFDRDLARCRADLNAARAGLLAVVTALSDADLDKAPRGHWTVRRVLEHTIWHEELYVRFVGHVRGQKGTEMADNTPSSVADAVERLTRSRNALLAGVDGVEEDLFYRLTKLGPEEYSILTMLENEANHEREHGAQVQQIVRG
jgi:uncharacterized damage-inducible protein DinB